MIKVLNPRWPITPSYLVCPVGILVILCSLPLLAEDLVVPGYRGNPGTTFQHWDFLVQPYPIGAPPIFPPGNTAQFPPDAGQFPAGFNPRYMARGVNPPGTAWLARFPSLPGVGVWRLDDTSGGTLDFYIPNYNRPRPKAIQVQVTYDVGPPVVNIVLPDGTIVPPARANTQEIQGYKHTTYDFDLETCPIFEKVIVKAPANGVVYIDQVVVDTICKPSVIDSLTLIEWIKIGLLILLVILVFGMRRDRSDATQRSGAGH